MQNRNPEIEEHRTPPRGLVLAAFGAIYLIWGSTYLGIRFAVETIPPFLLGGARFLLAGGILYAWLRLKGVPHPAGFHWRNAVVVGGLLLGVGNGGVNWAEQRVPSSLAALHGFDISWIDADTQRFYLADRSNKAIDVIDARTGTFVKTIPGGFAGVKFNAAGAANNDISGPNGVVTSGRWLFATDAPSRVVAIDLVHDSVVSTVSTSTSENRADEMAYDPDSGTLLVVNNADDPPFATLIHVNRNTGHLTVGARITFDAAHGVDATNGAEQPVWDKATGRFYISIPQVGADPADGAVARISPAAGRVDALFPVRFCQPAGLALGPRQDLLLGCSVVFDTAGNPWSATGTTTAAPISVIMDARNGSIDRRVAGVSGSDEVWFNRGDGRYYLAARSQAGGPVLGVIDARGQALVQVLPTINVAGKANVFPAGTAHSVAVDPRNNHVLVPLAANNVFPACLNGCVAVFAAPREEDGEGH